MMFVILGGVLLAVIVTAVSLGFILEKKRAH